MGQDYNIFEDSNDSLGEIENKSYDFGNSDFGDSDYGYSGISATDIYDQYMENKGHDKPLRWQYNSDEEFEIAIKEYERIRDEMIAWRNLPSTIIMWIVLIFFGIVALAVIYMAFMTSPVLGIIVCVLIKLFIFS